MKIITRYMLKQFLPILGLTLAGFLGIYLIVDFFEKVDSMMGRGTPPTEIFAYFAFKVPFIITQGLPVATLLGTLIALGILKRNHELIAMEASGIHRITYIKPIIFTALLFSLAHFLFAESVARTLNQYSEAIWQENVVERGRPASFSHENVWYHGKGTIYQIRIYDPTAHLMEKVTLYFMDDHFQLKGRIDARRISWTGSGWVAEDGLELIFTEEGTKQNIFSRKELLLHETPKDFSSLETMPEELNWVQLHRYTRKIQGEGFNALPYEVELHMRVAFPLTTFIFTLLALGIALRHRIQGGVPANIVVALLIALVYLAVLHMGSGLATAGVLSPALGVWAGNMILLTTLLYFWVTNP